MNTYKVTLSESEVKGIGVSRWSARQGRRLIVLAISVLFWLGAGLWIALNTREESLQVICAVFAVAPPLAFWYFVNKAFRRAGLQFLEMVKKEQA